MPYLNKRRFAKVACFQAVVELVKEFGWGIVFTRQQWEQLYDMMACRNAKDLDMNKFEIYPKSCHVLYPRDSNQHPSQTMFLVPFMTRHQKLFRMELGNFEQYKKIKKELSKCSCKFVAFAGGSKNVVIAMYEDNSYKVFPMWFPGGRCYSEKHASKSSFGKTQLPSFLRPDVCFYNAMTFDNYYETQSNLDLRKPPILTEDVYNGIEACYKFELDEDEEKELNQKAKGKDKDRNQEKEKDLITQKKKKAKKTPLDRAPSQR